MDFADPIVSGDEMEIIDSSTMGRKLTVGKDNVVTDSHDCTFTVFDENAQCIKCGKSLGDFITEDADPSNPRIPIILLPGGDE